MVRLHIGDNHVSALICDDDTIIITKQKGKGKGGGEERRVLVEVVVEGGSRGSCGEGPLRGVVEGRLLKGGC